MANDDEFDPFAPSTGLPDNVDVEITEAWFGFDPQYMDGQRLLIFMSTKSDDIEYGQNGEEVLRYSCGKGWIAEGRGETAVMESGGRKGFNENSAYFLFIKHAIECDGAEPVLRGDGRGDPRVASMWAGTKWHLDRKGHDYGGQIGVITRLMPTKFLGVSGQGQIARPSGPAMKSAGPGPVKATGPVKKAAPTANGISDSGAGGGNWGKGNQMYDTLFAMALEALDHESFMEKAYGEVAGVNGDADVEKAVMDNGPGSIWALAVAEYEAQNS